MGTLVAIDNKQQEPTPETYVVEILRDLLAQAERGELRTMIAVTVDKDGSLGNIIVGEASRHVYTLIGGIEVIKRDMMDGLIERSI